MFNECAAHEGDSFELERERDGSIETTYTSTCTPAAVASPLATKCAIDGVSDTDARRYTYLVIAIIIIAFTIWMNTIKWLVWVTYGYRIWMGSTPTPTLAFRFQIYVKLNTLQCHLYSISFFSLSFTSNGIPVFRIFREYISCDADLQLLKLLIYNKARTLLPPYIVELCAYHFIVEYFILIQSSSYPTHRPNCKCRLICLIYIYRTQRNELKAKEKNRRKNNLFMNERKICVHSRDEMRINNRQKEKKKKQRVLNV